MVQVPTVRRRKVKRDAMLVFVKKQRSALWYGTTHSTLAAFAVFTYQY
jgi:hypothetical protein